LINNTFTRTHKIPQFQTTSKGSQLPLNLPLSLPILAKIKMAVFMSDGICPVDLYQFSDQLGGVDNYNIKQPSPATLKRESQLNSRQRGDSADVSTQSGPNVNLRTASHKPKKRLTKKMAYKKPSSLEALK
jgi:hypothetical protein